MGWGDWDYIEPLYFYDSVLEDLSEQELWNLYKECFESYKQEYNLQSFYDKLNKS